MDNRKLRWYNLDLPEVIELRDQLFEETGRISTIGISAFDSSWARTVETQGAALFIIEGLTMYLTAEEVATLLGIIRDNFDHAMVMIECISPVWVARQGVERSIAKTGAKFRWGANGFNKLGSIGNGFHKVKDDNILRGMAAIQPIYHIFSKLPLAKKITQKILIFERGKA